MGLYDIGNRFKSITGEYCTIVEYISCRKVGIVFDNHTTKRYTRTEYLKSGDLYNPENSRKKYFIGQRFYSDKWGVTIIKKFLDNSPRVLIEFCGEYSCEIEALPSNLAKGLVRNPLQPAVYSRGYLGIGCYDSKDKAYCIWVNILQRCYSGSLDSYSGTEVSKDWLNYQHFARDYHEMLKTCTFSDPQIDKDLLSSKYRGKIYSKETCCLLPHQLNTALQLLSDRDKRSEYPCGVSFDKLTNKYKAQISKYGKQVYIGEYFDVETTEKAYLEEKQKYFNELATKYKSQLPEVVYSALVNKIKESSK